MAPEPVEGGVPAEAAERNKGGAEAPGAEKAKVRAKAAAVAPAPAEIVQETEFQERIPPCPAPWRRYRTGGKGFQAPPGAGKAKISAGLGKVYHPG